MAAGITAANTMMMMNPKHSENSDNLRVHHDEVRFGLWKKISPWQSPVPSLVTKISPNKNNKSHVESLRATQRQQDINNCLNDLSSRQRTVPVIQVLLEDNNGAIWDELKEICEEFRSSEKPRPTSKLLLEIVQFLLKHDERSIHRKIKLIHGFLPPRSENSAWIHSCYNAEYGVGVIRMIGKLFRLFKWGRNSSTLFIRLITHINNDDVCMEEYRNCLAELDEDDDVDVEDLFFRVCKGDNVAVHLTSTICLQPRILLFASAEQDFGESPPELVFDSSS